MAGHGETTDTSCAVTGCNPPTGSGACPACGTCCGGDPYACAAAMWKCASMQAMKEVQVQLMKERIQKAWGAKMGKAADAAVEAMGVCWQSMLAQSKAKTDFTETLRSLWQEGQK